MKGDPSKSLRRAFIPSAQVREILARQRRFLPESSNTTRSSAAGSSSISPLPSPTTRSRSRTSLSLSFSPPPNSLNTFDVQWYLKSVCLTNSCASAFRAVVVDVQVEVGEFWTEAVSSSSSSWWWWCLRRRSRRYAFLFVVVVVVRRRKRVTQDEAV